MRQKRTSEPAHDQLSVLKNLKQTAAAYLLGYSSARILRDLPDIPRQANGNYDAADLVRWARTHQPRPDFTEDEIERTLQILDWTCPDDVQALLDFLEETQRRHGDGGLLVFLDELMNCLRDAASREEKIGDTPPPPMTRVEELRLLESENQERLTRWYKRRLAIRVVCENCGRVRHGRRWVRCELVEAEPSVKGVCPDCEKKGAAAQDWRIPGGGGVMIPRIGVCHGRIEEFLESATSDSSLSSAVFG